MTCSVNNGDNERARLHRLMTEARRLLVWQKEIVTGDIELANSYAYRMSLVWVTDWMVSRGINRIDLGGVSVSSTTDTDGDLNEFNRIDIKEAW